MQKKVTIPDILALYAEIFLNVKEKVQTWKGNKVSKLLEWIARSMFLHCNELNV